MFGAVRSAWRPSRFRIPQSPTGTVFRCLNVTRTPPTTSPANVLRRRQPFPVASAARASPSAHGRESRRRRDCSRRSELVAVALAPVQPETSARSRVRAENGAVVGVARAQSRRRRRGRARRRRRPSGSGAAAAGAEADRRRRTAGLSALAMCDARWSSFGAAGRRRCGRRGGRRRRVGRRRRRRRRSRVGHDGGCRVRRRRNRRVVGQRETGAHQRRRHNAERRSSQDASSPAHRRNADRRRSAAWGYVSGGVRRPRARQGSCARPAAPRAPS